MILISKMTRYPNMPQRACFQRAFAFLLFGLLGAGAQAASDPARIVHLLQYIAVDYAGAVAEGRVINEVEYDEMVEFAATTRDDLEGLPPVAETPVLLAAAADLAQIIGQRAAPAAVAERASALAAAILQAYDVLPVPAATPDIARGAGLYATHCAGCHGAGGHGDGPAGAGLEPPPSAFTDRSRQALLNVLTYFNTISYGVAGTGMAAYEALPDQDRWALAFYLATLAAEPGQIEAGQRIWETGGTLPLTSLAQVVTARPADLGNAVEQALLAYLWAHPEALAPAANTALATARELLTQSAAAAAAGRLDEAQRLAIAAYLDGFELAESRLAARDRKMKLELEGGMMRFRELLRGTATQDEIARARAELDAGLVRAGRLLGTGGGDTFWIGLSGALLVIVREGLEALLVVAALLAFARRFGAGRGPIHYGWTTALGAGFITWVLAAFFITISGATRELSEGAAALLASGVLFYMGFWMHDKSHAVRWHDYLNRRMEGALKRGSRFGLGALAFIAVYREVFETILFMQALWLSAAADGRLGLVAGGIVAAAILGVLAWLILRLSARLPLGPFFAWSAALMYLLAVVFAGKGVMALQEVGILPLSEIAFPRIDWLGIYPSRQSLALQLVMLLLLVYVLWIRPRFAAGKIKVDG